MGGGAIEPTAEPAGTPADAGKSDAK